MVATRSAIGVASPAASGIGGERAAPRWQRLVRPWCLAAGHQAVAELRPAIDARPDERGDNNDDGDDSPARHASGVHAS